MNELGLIKPLFLIVIPTAEGIPSEESGNPLNFLILVFTMVNFLKWAY